MAKKPDTPPQNQSPLTQQALRWISEAELDKSYQLPFLRDYYRFFKPWAKRPQEWRQKNDQDEIFDNTAIEANADFSADMQTTFTPVEDDWLDVEPAQTMQSYTAAQLKDPLAKYKNTIFSEVRRSNFHEASLESYSDLAAGTCAMLVQDFDIASPIECQSVPISDLLIYKGRGGVDFRCRMNDSMSLRDLQPTYQTATFPQSILDRTRTDPIAKVKIRECFWRLWDIKGVERWQYVLLVDSVECDSRIYDGEGSCPLLVARWRTDGSTAWGFGAGYVVMPTVKTLDQWAYLKLKKECFRVDRVGFYDDDQTLNFDNGLEPGNMYPRVAGSKIDFMESDNDVQADFFVRKEMQDEIKRALFQDKPQQTGDTPPTAAQWMDQKAEIARRMGAPIGRLTTEWQWTIFKRFAYVLEKRGILPQVSINGKTVHLRPQSPLVKAQRQNSVVQAERLMQTIAQGFGPQLVPLLVDAIQTAANIKDKLGDQVVVLRSDADISGIIQKAALVAQQAGALPGGPQDAAPQMANAA